MIPKWLRLNEIDATGKPVESVNQEGAGSEFFQNFVNDIFPMSYPAAQTLARHLNMNGGGEVRVLDLAAGSGVWGIALAQASDRVRVTAVDWPDVIPVTRKTVERFGLGGRFSYIEGDLLKADFEAITQLPRWATFFTAKARRAAGNCFRKPSVPWQPEGRLPSPNFW